MNETGNYIDINEAKCIVKMLEEKEGA